MKYRKFGKTDLTVSEIGFGAWAIGGNAMVGKTPIGWGQADDDESIRAIKKSLSNGVNFFDTADFYGLGHSERLLGKVLGSNREVVIATKVGHRNIDNSIVLDYSRKYILEACEASLRRLNREYIDYYQLHSARLNHLENYDCIEAMELLRKQGKIRYYGLSLNTFSPEPEATFMMDRQVGDGFQLVFNLINQRAAALLENAAQAGYGIIARMPLQFGLLTGKIKRDARFAEDDHRHFRLTAQIVNNALTVLEEVVWPLCTKYNITKTSLALSFILSFPAVNTVIPGIRTSQQAEDNTTGLVELATADMLILKTAYEHYFQKVVTLMEERG